MACQGVDIAVLLDWDVGPPVPWRNTGLFGEFVKTINDTEISMSYSFEPVSKNQCKLTRDDLSQQSSRPWRPQAGDLRPLQHYMSPSFLPDQTH